MKRVAGIAGLWVAWLALLGMEPVWLAPAALPVADVPEAAANAETGFLAILPLDSALGAADLQSSPAAMISDREVLLYLPPERRAAADALTSRGFSVVAPAVPSGRIWIVAGSVPDDAAREAGVTTIYRTGRSTIIAADRDSAYRLLDLGFFIAEATLVPVSQLQPPDFGESFTERLLASRPLTPARRKFLSAIATGVNPDTLRSTIAFLDYDQTISQYRSRFAPRHEMRRVVRPYLSQVLGDRVAAVGGTVEDQEFKPDLPPKYQGDDSIFVNVIATKPGRLTSAYYLVCAHYDAIASRDPLWQVSNTEWLTLPAPGADDNASGTAGVLEVARLLDGIPLDVGVKFATFSGEELGLLGSKFYANGLPATDSLIAAINLDMIGYVQNGKFIGLTHDVRSKWLSDLLEETAAAVGIESQTGSFDFTGIYRSDHGAFWALGLPAVTLDDRQDIFGNPLYPFYHTLGDTLGHLDMGQVSDNAALVAAYLARFAQEEGDTVSDIALTAGSVEWSWQGASVLVAGNEVTATVRAINQGASMLDPEPYRFEIWRGERGTGALVHSENVSLEVLSGEYAFLEASWRTDPDIIGIIPHTFVLTPLSPGVESDTTNNIVEVTLSVMPPSAVVSNLHVFPNPLTGGAAPHVYFEIWQPRSDFSGHMDLTVYDIEGNRMAEGTLVRNFTGDKEIATGPNSIDLGEVFPGGLDLAPGLYVLFAELSVQAESGLVRASTKFAVAR